VCTGTSREIGCGRAGRRMCCCIWARRAVRGDAGRAGRDGTRTRGWTPRCVARSVALLVLHVQVHGAGAGIADAGCCWVARTSCAGCRVGCLCARPECVCCVCHGSASTGCAHVHTLTALIATSKGPHDPRVHAIHRFQRSLLHISTLPRMLCSTPRARFAAIHIAPCVRSMWLASQHRCSQEVADCSVHSLARRRIPLARTASTFDRVQGNACFPACCLRRLHACSADKRQAARCRCCAPACSTNKSTVATMPDIGALFQPHRFLLPLPTQ
jgi:hypothetical protein